MTATIYRLPVRRRAPKLSDDPKVRKAVSVLALVSVRLAKAAIEAIEEFERTKGPPPAA